MKQKEPFSQRLARATEEFDLIFNHLLGYIIAFTSIVAFADVLGNGQVTSSIPWLFWIWVFAQGMCVEYQVLVLIKRMPGYWKNNRVMFFTYAGFIVCLCAMSVLIGSVYVQHDQQRGSVEQAMSSLGIPHIAFIYARSALAILLVTLIGIDRAIEQHRHHEQEGQRVQQEQERSEQVHAQFTGRLDELTTAQAELAARFTQMVTLLPSLVEQVTEIQAHIPEVSQAVHTSIGEVQARSAHFMQTTVTEVKTLSTALSELRTTLPELIAGQVAVNLEQVHQGLIEQTQTMRSLLPPSQRGEQDTTQEVHREPHLELIRGTGSSGVSGSTVQRFILSEREQGRTPTISEVMNATGCSKGSASRHRNEVMNQQQAKEEQQALLIKQRTRQA